MSKITNDNNGLGQDAL